MLLILLQCTEIENLIKKYFWKQINKSYITTQTHKPENNRISMLITTISRDGCDKSRLVSHTRRDFRCGVKTRTRHEATCTRIPNHTERYPRLIQQSQTFIRFSRKEAVRVLFAKYSVNRGKMALFHESDKIILTLRSFLCFWIFLPQL